MLKKNLPEVVSSSGLMLKLDCGRSAPAVFSWILAARLIMRYKGISLVDHIYLGAYEMLELDIYALVACYKMFEWIKCLVIKIKLV